jgi:uncharacterized protein (UPF0261 family)
MSTIAVLGTFDTKGIEHAFVADQIRRQGHQPLMVNVGALEASQIPADISCEEVAAAAGVDLAALKTRKDRGETVAAMAKAAAAMLQKLVAERKIEGVISLGGGGGTAIGTAAMRALPVGFPKVMVSTLASGNTAQYVGSKDIVMIPSIVDVAGLNRISRPILTRAAGAICGMVSAQPPPAEDKPIIAASMFGNTTVAVNHAKGLLEQAGYEVLVFHATGTGGRTMESLIESGMVSGVLDITTTEWADEVAGGFLTAGPTRLEAAARKGIPAIVTPGCLDMVNFHGPESVPAQYQGRKFYQHNPQVTLMRTNVEENRAMGRVIAERLNLSTGPVTVLLPLKGFSVIAAPGGPFHDAAADQAFLDELKQHLRKDIPVIEMDCVVNDLAFAERCARTLLEQIAKKA